MAAEYLQQHPELKEKLLERRQKDASFAKNASAQLEFVYQNSPYREPAHNLYPVFRLLKSEEILERKPAVIEGRDTNKKDE